MPRLRYRRITQYDNYNYNYLKVTLVLARDTNELDPG